jgi:ketosteroid isomerase-like protein
MRIWFSILIVLMSVQLSLASEPRESDHTELRSLMNDVTVAMNERDVLRLTKSLAREFSVTTVDQKTLTSTKQLEDYFEKTFNSPNSLVTDFKIAPQADVLTKFMGETSGFCYGENLESYTMRDGRKVEMKSRWTAALIKEDGRWKIAAVHAGVNFLDNPLVHKLGSAVTRSTALGFVVGAVVMLLVSFVFRKLKSKSKGTN